MGLTVYWTQFAEDKLKDIYDYYKIKAGSRIAKKLVNGIIDKAIGLEKNPLIGQQEQLLIDRQEEFRYLVYKKYKIIYWSNKTRNRIEIINVFDCRQNPTKMNEIK